MLRIAMAGLFCLVLIPAAYAAAPHCPAGASTPPLPLPATVIVPAALEFYTRSVQLGMPSGVLVQTYSDAQSADRVLLRMRVESCQELAKAIPSGGPVNANDPAAYKPQTAFDNTPWRFDMNQGGKRMTADEFDAWMKARGVRVVKARSAPEAAAAPAAEPAADVKPVGTQ